MLLPTFAGAAASLPTGCHVDLQTTEIKITVPPRNEDAPVLPSVAFTRTQVLVDASGNQLAVLASETRVVNNPTSIEDFAMVHAALKAAGDELFADVMPQPPA